jgi:hypothetical protein
VLDLILSITLLHAQIQVLKIVGKENKDYKLGFGAYLKFTTPVSESDYVSAEVGLNAFQYKPDENYGMLTIPIKLGYRYTLDRSGTGLYLEPQLGYNIYGMHPVYNETTYQYDEPKTTGPAGAIQLGYLFEPGNKIQFDLSVFYETVLHSGSTTSYAGFRLAHNFSFGRRE